MPGEVRDERGVLDHRADPRAAPATPGPHPPAEEPGLARGRPDQTDEHAQRRRLARAVRAEQPADLARLDLEVEVRDRLDAAVALGQAANGDHGGVGHRRDPRPRLRRLDPRGA